MVDGCTLRGIVYVVVDGCTLRGIVYVVVDGCTLHLCWWINYISLLCRLLFSYFFVNQQKSVNLKNKSCLQSHLLHGRLNFIRPLVILLLYFTSVKLSSFMMTCSKHVWYLVLNNPETNDNSLCYNYQSYIKKLLYNDEFWFFFHLKRERKTSFSWHNFDSWIEPQKCIRMQDFVSSFQKFYVRQLPDLPKKF